MGVLGRAAGDLTVLQPATVLRDLAPAMRAWMVVVNTGILAALAALAAAPSMFAVLGVPRAIIRGGAITVGFGVLGLLRHAQTDA